MNWNFRTLRTFFVRGARLAERLLFSGQLYGMLVLCVV